MFLRNTDGEVVFYLLVFTFSLQTTSKHNTHRYCSWDTDVCAEILRNFPRARQQQGQGERTGYGAG